MKVKIGKKLEAFHDGKRSPSRMTTVEVVDVVPITDMSKKRLRIRNECRGGVSRHV